MSLNTARKDRLLIFPLDERNWFSALLIFLARAVSITSFAEKFAWQNLAEKT